MPVYQIREVVNSAFQQGHNRFGNAAGYVTLCSLYSVLWQTVVHFRDRKATRQKICIEGYLIYKSLNRICKKFLKFKNMVFEPIRECFRKIGRDGSTPLPKTTLAILFTLLFFSGMTMTMVFSYLPKLVKWFGTSEVDTGYYAGLIASAMYVGRTIFCFIWGYIADVKGKKLTSIVCTICLTLSTLAFGFSYSFYWALGTRFLQGASMGLIVVSKSILMDICDDTNVTLGMAILLSSFSVGLLTGPSLAGFLVFPAEQYPNLFSEDGIFGRFGVLLPNLLIIVGFCVATVLAIFYLPKDGRILTGEESYLINSDTPKTNRYVDSVDSLYEVASFKLKNRETYFNLSIDESDVIKREGIQYYQIIEPTSGFSLSTIRERKSLKYKIKNSKITQVLKNKWCVVCGILYGTYSLVAIGFDEMFPLYASTAKLYRGIGFSPANIGLALLISAAVLIVIQLTILTKLTTKFGCKKMFIFSVLTLGICVPLLPSIAATQNKTWLWIALSTYLLICRVAMAEAFLTVNIMLNNSVDASLLGSANGLGMSFSSIGRAMAPTLFGSIYSWSLTNIKGVEGNENALGFPLNQYFTFFVLSLLAILNVIIASQIPDSLDHEPPRADTTNSNPIDDIPTTSRITNVSVSYFTPSID